MIKNIPNDEAARIAIILLFSERTAVLPDESYYLPLYRKMLDAFKRRKHVEVVDLVGHHLVDLAVKTCQAFGLNFDEIDVFLDQNFDIKVRAAVPPHMGTLHDQQGPHSQ